MEPELAIFLASPEAEMACVYLPSHWLAADVSTSCVDAVLWLRTTWPSRVRRSV